MAAPFTGIGGAKRLVRGFFDFPSLEQFYQQPQSQTPLLPNIETAPYPWQQAYMDLVPGGLFGQGLEQAGRGNVMQGATSAAYGLPDVFPLVGVAGGIVTDAMRQAYEKSKYFGKPFVLELQPKPRKVTTPKPRPKAEFAGYPKAFANKRGAQKLEDRAFKMLMENSNPADFQWYDEFGKVVREATSDKDMQERIVRIAAILSANQGAEQNILDTVRAASMIARGEVDLAIGQHPNVASSRLKYALEKDLFDTRRPFNAKTLQGVGRKVENFYKEMKAVTFGTERPDTVVVDRHQLRFGGWDKKKIRADSKEEYDVQENLVRRLTKRLNSTIGSNYSTGQVQAGAWHAWQRASRGIPADQPIPRSSFLEGMEKTRVMMPREHVPSTKTPAGREVSWRYTPYTQELLTQRLEEAGKPKELLYHAGLPLSPVRAGAGSYQGNISANRVAQPFVPVKPGNVIEEEIPNAGTAAVQHAMLQDEVPWWRPDYRPKQKGKEGIRIISEKPVQLRNLQKELIKEFGEDPGWTAAGPGEVHIVNFAGDKDFDAKVANAIIRSGINAKTSPYVASQSGSHTPEQAAEILRSQPTVPGRPSLWDLSNRARLRVAETVEAITGRSATPRPELGTERYFREVIVPRWNKRKVPAVHYGAPGLETIDPAMVGKGKNKIPEEMRPGGRGWMERKYPGMHEGYMDRSFWGHEPREQRQYYAPAYQKEPNLPGRPENTYRTNLVGVYDMARDVAGLHREAAALSKGDPHAYQNALEHLVRGYGFKGMVDNKGIVRYFEPVNVNQRR